MAIEYRLAIIYLIVGTLWILFSDRLVLEMVPDAYHIYLISTYKGWFFILVTSILLFLLVRRESVKRDLIQDKLILANKRAVESDKLKSAFLSNLSHYLRTPMNSILGFVDLLEYRNLDPEKRAKFTAIIDEQSQELLQLLNNIIEIAKIQEGQLEVEECTFSFNEMIHKLQLTNESKLSNWKPGISLSNTIELKDGEDRLLADYNKILMIFSNLLSNATKFTSHGHIEFGYIQVGSEMECYVCDTGKGISPEKKEKILSEFMHSSHILQDVNEGSSLGLYLSSGLARSMGGKLWLDYSNASGTQFKFTFPYKKA